MELGFTLMSEEHGPRELVELGRRAEAEGFDFLVQSDHIHPWVPEEGHSPYAWSVLSAVAAVTERIHLATFVTCPILRYHPVVVAQKAATLSLISEGRFTLSVGAGERLNEHVVGRGWPPVDVRHEMLEEAVGIIRTLWEGGYHSHRGPHFTVEDARIFDLPDESIPIAVAASGPESVALAARVGDELVAIDPDADAVATFREAHDSAPATCQVPVSYAADRATAVETAHRYFRWSALSWPVMAELPNPTNFDAATKVVTPDAVAEQIPCGSDADAVVEAVRPYVEAGFDRVALVQVGPDQEGFMGFWDRELRDRLVGEFGSSGT